MAGALIDRKGVWWHWSATRSSTKAIFSKPYSKAGNRAYAIAGGSSTTTGRASTPSCAKGLWERYEQLFRNFGWNVVILKYGSLQQSAFKEPGGEELRQWIDNCPNPLYSALAFAGGAAWRKRLNDEIGDQGDVSRLIEKRSDDELAALMNNLGGHDLPSLLEAFRNADNDRPTCFISYTIKGFGLPMAGHKDNHAG